MGRSAISRPASRWRTASPPCRLRTPREILTDEGSMGLGDGAQPARQRADAASSTASTMSCGIRATDMHLASRFAAANIAPRAPQQVATLQATFGLDRGSGGSAVRRGQPA